jgi:hypothetical protein
MVPLRRRVRALDRCARACRTPGGRRRGACGSGAYRSGARLDKPTLRTSAPRRAACAAAPAGAIAGCGSARVSAAPRRRSGSARQRPRSAWDTKPAARRGPLVRRMRKRQPPLCAASRADRTLPRGTGAQNARRASPACSAAQRRAGVAMYTRRLTSLSPPLAFALAAAAARARGGECAPVRTALARAARRPRDTPREPVSAAGRRTVC